jgi:hypothetical protein
VSLVDASSSRARDRRQSRFPCSDRRLDYPVDVTEVTLAVDERIAHGEILRETGQRIVDRLVAMGVIVAHGLANDLGTLAIAAVGVESQLAHGKEDAPVPA